MGLGDDLKFGTALSEKQLYDPAMAPDLRLKGVHHSGLGKARIMDVDGPAHQEKRQEGTDQGQEDKLAIESGIIDPSPGLVVFRMGISLGYPFFIHVLFHLILGAA